MSQVPCVNFRPKKLSRSRASSVWYLKLGALVKWDRRAFKTFLEFLVFEFLNPRWNHSKVRRF